QARAPDGRAGPAEVPGGGGVRLSGHGRAQHHLRLPSERRPAGGELDVRGGLHVPALRGGADLRLAPVQVRSRLRDLREQRGWSQGELARRLGVSRQTVNAIETEKYDPSLPLAFKVSRIFRLPIEEVFED